MRVPVEERQDPRPEPIKRRSVWYGWSMTEFVKGWINKRFLAFVIITHFVVRGVFDHQTDTIKEYLLIIWAVVTVVWMLCGSLEKMISKGNLNVDAKIGLGK